MVTRFSTFLNEMIHYENNRLGGNWEGFQVPDSEYQFTVTKIPTHSDTIRQLKELGITKTMKGHSWQERAFSVLHRVRLFWRPSRYLLNRCHKVFLWNNRGRSVKSTTTSLSSLEQVCVDISPTSLNAYMVQRLGKELFFKKKYYLLVNKREAWLSDFKT